MKAIAIIGIAVAISVDNLYIGALGVGLVWLALPYLQETGK